MEFRLTSLDPEKGGSRVTVDMKGWCAVLGKKRDAMGKRSKRKHPNSESLDLTQVESGSEQLVMSMLDRRRLSRSRGAIEHESTPSNPVPTLCIFPKQPEISPSRDPDPNL